MTDGGTSPSPWQVLNAARRAVPAVNFALGLAGLAAAATIIRVFIGDGQAAVASIAVMLLGMVLLYFVSRITSITTKRPSPQEQVIVWAITLFVCFILALSLSVLTVRWPEPLAQIYGLAEVKDGTEEGTMAVSHTGSLATLKHLMSISVPQSEFTLTMENDSKLERMWIVYIEDENYQGLFKKLCMDYPCLSCEPPAEEITNRVFLSVRQELEEFTKETENGKVTYYRCKQ